MRLFVALELSQDTTQAIQEWRKPMADMFPVLRWTSENQLHITLRFLGNSNPDDVIFQMKTLALEELLPVEYTLSETGNFGEPPFVIWLSGKFSSSLFTMARRLEHIPDGYGKTGETRKFIPHVTIARVNPGVQCPRLNLDTSIGGAAQAVSLIESELTSDGPVYSILYSVS
ncbi:MAG: RNA 2',3'-cyclic phosphodiesterase [Candidatus Fermentibacteraceae bacterium]|nr:RNA 2',3'-cyclic phosphodiesterase [Candidatus Fermentibacteraceae bacterium]